MSLLTTIEVSPSILYVVRKLMILEASAVASGSKIIVSANDNLVVFGAQCFGFLGSLYERNC